MLRLLSSIVSIQGSKNRLTLSVEVYQSLAQVLNRLVQYWHLFAVLVTHPFDDFDVLLYMNLCLLLVLCSVVVHCWIRLLSYNESIASISERHAAPMSATKMTAAIERTAPTSSGRPVKTNVLPRAPNMIGRSEMRPKTTRSKL